MSKVKANAPSSQAAAIDGEELQRESDLLSFQVQKIRHHLVYKKTGHGKWGSESSWRGEERRWWQTLLSASHTLRIVLPFCTSERNWTGEYIGHCTGVLQSISDGKAAPAVPPCFSGAFLQHVSLICCLLPDSSTCLAHSFPTTTGVLLAPSLQPLRGLGWADKKTVPDDHMSRNRAENKGKSWSLCFTLESPWTTFCKLPPPICDSYFLAIA